MKMIAILPLMVVAALASNEAEDFFYQRGVEAGYRQGFDEGVAAGIEEAKKILAKYKNEVRAYEVGKFFVNSGYLSYPKIWQRVDGNGNVKIEIEPSRIEKPLNIAEIFNKFGTLPTNPNPEKVAQDPISARNSVYSASRDTSKFLPNKADSNQNIVTISIEKSSKNEEILKKSNLVYSVDKDTLKVMFFNRTQKNDFCAQFKICE